MIEHEVLRWAITTALSAATVYCAVRAGSRSPLVIRVNYGLHALMALAMIGMLFHGWEWPRLPQILAFALAAWWFAVQAVSTRAQQGSGTVNPGSGKSLYDAFVMAAMAFMLAVTQIAGFSSTGNYVPGRAAASVGRGTHHGPGSAVGPVSLPGTDDWTNTATFALAIVFSMACLLWAVRLLKSIGHGSRVPSASFTRGCALRSADLGNEFVSASAMAVMFAVLAA